MSFFAALVATLSPNHRARRTTPEPLFNEAPKNNSRSEPPSTTCGPSERGQTARDSEQPSYQSLRSALLDGPLPGAISEQSVPVLTDSPENSGRGSPDPQSCHARMAASPIHVLHDHDVHHGAASPSSCGKSGKSPSFAATDGSGTPAPQPHDALKNGDTRPQSPLVAWRPTPLSRAEVGHMSAQYLEPVLEVARHNFAARLLDAANERCQPLPSLVGFTDLEAVSFEEAFISLSAVWQSSDSLVATCRTLVRDRCKFLAPEVHDDAASAMALYMASWAPHEVSFCHGLNMSLRERGAGTPTPWFGMLKLIVLALTALEPFQGDVWRGVRGCMESLYPVGSRVTWWGFASCLLTKQSLLKDHLVGRFGPRTLFRISTTCGYPMNSFGAFEQEELEVLLPPGLRFEVVQHAHLGSGLVVVQLHQVESPDCLLVEAVDLRRRAVEIETIEKKHQNQVQEVVATMSAHPRSSFEQIAGLKLFARLAREGAEHLW